jgi:hypothetical protein
MVLDLDHRNVVQGTFSLVPVPWPPFGPRQVGVVHDTRGHVTVRAWHEHGPYVIGKAMWEGARTVNRKGINANQPNTAQWDVVDTQTVQALQYASTQPPAGDPAAIDDAPLLAEDTPEGNRARLQREGKIPRDAPPSAPAAPASTVSKVGGAIASVFAIVIGVGYLYLRDRWRQGSIANGDVCTTDSECRSGNCERDFAGGKKHCSSKARCHRDSQCSKGQFCSSGMCLDPQPRGASCSLGRECKSGSCSATHGVGQSLCD